MSRQTTHGWHTAVQVGLFGVFIVTVLFPYYWMVMTALKPKTELMLSPPKWFPSYLTLEHFVSSWTVFSVPKYLLNSTYVAASTTVLAVLIASMAAYSLSRLRFRGSILVVTLLLITQLIPGIVTIIPFYFWMMELNLVNTRLGLILSYTTWAIPFATLMLRGYFITACPPEIEEAALIDGCTRWQAFWRVLMPISVPGLVATGAYAFMIAWNEFMWASVMLSRGDLKTLPVALRDMIGEAGNVEFLSEFMATSVICTIPVLLVFFYAQRFIVSGLTAGAVKG